MVVNRFKQLVVVAIVSGLMVGAYQVHRVIKQRDSALQSLGEYKQANTQLQVDLNAQQQRFKDLSLDYQSEQKQLAALYTQLKHAQQKAQQKQKVAYEIAKQSECGTQRLPDELIRLRQQHPRASH